jgi:hypothetical protein
MHVRMMGYRGYCTFVRLMSVPSTSAAADQLRCIRDLSDEYS